MATDPIKLQTNAKWRANNSDKKRAIDKLYRETHREEINAKIRERRASGEYKRKRVKRDKSYSKMRRNKRRCAIHAALGGKCIRCSFNDSRALQVDHVNGGGNQLWLKAKSPDTYYREILEHVLAGGKEYQLLCANCNQIKKHERGEHRRC